MSTVAGPATAPSKPVQIGRHSLSLGSVFGKTIRDSRRATIVVAGVLGFIFIAVSYAIVNEFSTPESRRQIAELVAAVPPIMQGLAGKAVNVDTLGGYLSYKYGTFFPLIVSLWSILALSGTLAAEARRGSLDFVATTPLSRRRIALEKLAGHILMLAIAMVVGFIAIVIAGSAFPVLPGDEIGVEGAAGYTIWLGLLALASGGLAFAIAPFLGRGAAVGIAGTVLFAGFILNGYQQAFPQVAPLANLAWFGWTADHIPLAGQFDWPSLGLVAVAALAFLVIGVEAFARRDVGATSAVPTPSLPRWLIGVRGPASRAFGEILPSALAWGLGLGLFGLMIAGSGRTFLDQLQNAPDFVRLLQTVFPNVDFQSSGWFLQLLFVEFGLVLAGLAAATLVAKWASDETSGRLEFLLATPLSRVRWVVGGGLAILAGSVVIVGLTGLGVLIGGLITGGDVVAPVVGTLVLGLYAIALAGIGLAFGGILRTGMAGAFVAVLTIVIWFVDILVPAFGLPDVIHDLALSAHYGQPMIGQWDPVGIVASIGLALAGVALGALGFERRDLRT